MKYTGTKTFTVSDTGNVKEVGKDAIVKIDKRNRIYRKGEYGTVKH